MEVKKKSERAINPRLQWVNGKLTIPNTLLEIKVKCLICDYEWLYKFKNSVNGQCIIQWKDNQQKMLREIGRGKEFVIEHQRSFLIYDTDNTLIECPLCTSSNIFPCKFKDIEDI